MSFQDWRFDRRRFLGSGLGLAALTCSGSGTRLLASAQEKAEKDNNTGGLIARVDRDVIFRGREGGTTWFHPRPCMVPGEGGPIALMTLQSIGGSDVFGPVHWTSSKDKGRTWSDPLPIAGLGRQTIENGQEMGVCDVVPEYHPQTNTVLAIGHNVYYDNNVLARPQGARWPVYVVRSPDGNWSTPRRLEWDDPRASAIYTCGCSQRLVLDNGDILVPLSYGPKERLDRLVTTARCTFDGQELRLLEVGNELTLEAGRGLLEPSLASFNDRYFLTIRAEDGHGYVAASADGLRWDSRHPWCWDDGEPLTMSTTQQHWLPHSEGLFLVYTRKAEENVNVMRWRAPLYLAEVDLETLRLIRASEQVVLPLIGDGIHAAAQVARMGNFHTIAAGPEESWVTVGETLPEAGWQGDTLLARVRWNRPNRLGIV